MTETILRLVLFTALPVLLGAAIVMFGRTATGPVRRAEAFLVPLFLIGIGGSGVTAFIANVFIAEPGSLLEREVGIANLAIGLLGAVAAERRDGFREATVAAAVVFSLGIALAHVMSASADLVQSIANLVTPALLVWFLLTLRRAEPDDPQTILLRGWMVAIRRGSVVAVGIAATAYAVGNSTGQLVLLSLAGAVAAAVAFWWIVSRTAAHKASAA